MKFITLETRSNTFAGYKYSKTSEVKDEECIEQFINWKLTVYENFSFYEGLIIKRKIYEIIALLQDTIDARLSDVYQYFSLKISLYRTIVLLDFSKIKMDKVDLKLKQTLRCFRNDSNGESVQVDNILDDLKKYLLCYEIEKPSNLNIKKLALVSFISTLIDAFVTEEGSQSAEADLLDSARFYYRANSNI